MHFADRVICDRLRLTQPGLHIWGEVARVPRVKTQAIMFSMPCVVAIICACVEIWQRRCKESIAAWMDGGPSARCGSRSGLPD
eukprot:1253638-Pyramimonas_sp.AAC.1